MFGPVFYAKILGAILKEVVHIFIAFLVGFILGSFIF